MDGARCSHLFDKRVHAVMVRPSERGTRKPLIPESMAPTPFGYARVTVATEAYGISHSVSVASGETVRTRSAAAKAGVAMITTSASSDSAAVCTRQCWPLGSMRRAGGTQAHIGCAERLREALDHHAEPAVERDQARARPQALCRGPAERPQASDETGVPAGYAVKVRGGAANAELVRRPRVDPAQQRVDQAVDDLAAQTASDVGADGHVVADRCAGQHEVETGAQHAEGG